MSKIVEDTISRNQKFQEERRQRLEKLKALKAPDQIIAIEEIIAKMTLAEYQVYCHNIEEEEKYLKSQYAKHNPIQEAIVNEIYDRESKLEYDRFVYYTVGRFIEAIDPLSFMSQDDYDYDLYRTFLHHAKEIYRERFKQRFKEKS